MLDDNDDIENVSGLNLLESLDLGRRKIYKEEAKEKENEDFVDNINLLLSKLNERIDALKNLPKLEIKPFDIDSIKSNRNSNNNNINTNSVQVKINSMNNSENQNKNPYISNISSKNIVSNNPSNLINKNNGTSIEETPFTPEGNQNNLKFKIPDSTNENINKANNNLNNSIQKTDDIIELESNGEDSRHKENISNNIDTNNNKNILNESKKNSERNSINNKSETIPKKPENENEKENNNENQNNNENKKNNENIDELIEINENNLNEIDSIPEVTENNNKPEEKKDDNINNNISREKSSRKSESREGENGINQSFNKKENSEENKPFDIKNSELAVEEVEVFEPTNQINESEQNNLRHINNNNANKKIEEESQERIEEISVKQKEENDANENSRSEENNKKEEKKESVEDQYDKEFNKLQDEFNLKKTINTNNNEENENNSQNSNNPKENGKENQTEERKSESKEKEDEKNDLKKQVIKRDSEEDNSVEIMSEKDNDEKEEKKIEKKEEKEEQEDMGKKEETKKETKKQKGEKTQEDEIEIVSEKSISIENGGKDNKDNKEEKKSQEEINNHNNIKNILNNSSLKNIKEEDEEDVLSPSSKIKQSTLSKLNTIPQIKESNRKNSYKKSFTQKGDILIQIKSNTVRTEKDESFPDVSNIDEYPVLTNLIEEDKSLDQLIPEFNEKILKNEKENIELRKNSLIKKKCIPLNIDEGQNYSQFFGDLEISHPELMQTNYNEENFKAKIQRNSEFEKIFENLSFDEINSPIGVVESFEIFCQRYTLTKEDVKNTLNSIFSKWRKILGDGNSLYRIIMFSIFEAYIFNKNMEQLKFLIYDIINQDLNIYEKHKVDIEICSMIFAEILYLLDQDNNVKAYEIFVKSFSLKDGSFDKMLLIYIRHILSIYSANVKEILSDEDRNNINNSNIFNTYMIEYNNIEPSFLNLCSIQYLFDIKINMVYLHGGLAKPEQRTINLVSEEDDNPIINIGFFYSSYHKLYPQNFEVTYNCQLPLQKTILRQLTFIMKDTRRCEACKSVTEHILFIDKKYFVCKFCLENALTKICNFRSDSFMKNGFLGSEYYTRPIQLQGSYYIDDYEIIELLEYNIFETIIQKYLAQICSNCGVKQDNTIELKCGCEFCKACLEEVLLSKTKGKKVLNEFEKSQIKSAKCSCGQPFDFETGLELISKNKKDKEDALNRLRKYINTLCLICTKELRVEGKKNEYKDKNESVKYKKIKMKKMNSKGEEGKIYESEHLLCEECFKKFMGRKIDIKELDDDEEDDIKNDFVDIEKEIISCSICCKKHLFKITQEGGCCAGDCVIY